MAELSRSLRERAHAVGRRRGPRDVLGPVDPGLVLESATEMGAIVSEPELSPRVSLAGLARAFPLAARDLIYILVAVFGLVSVWIWLVDSIGGGIGGFDFEGTLWEPARAILDARSPYPRPVLSEVEVGNPALYPPLLMLLVTPLAILPWSIGLGVWIALLGVAIGASLYVLGVRDWRCYALALVSTPVVVGLTLGNATLLLVLPVALAWRWRDRWLRCAVVIGLAIAAKLFLWPLLFWLLGTRRYRAAGAALVASAAAAFVPWAALGFSGLSAYPDLLRMAEDLYAVHSFSIATILSGIGVDASRATALTVGIGVILGLFALAAGRRGRDELSLSLAILAAVIGSPIMWEYYYALLFVPLAIARPRFSGLWLLPILFWATRLLPRSYPDASEFEAGGSACCKPANVPFLSWAFNHAPPHLWPALGHLSLALAITALAFLFVRRQRMGHVSARSPP